MLGAAERRAAVDGELVRADPLDLRPECDQEVRQILHVRLAGRVAQDGRAARQHRAAIAFSVPVTLGSSRNTSAPRSSAPPS
jgi:hypothetical protein